MALIDVSQRPPNQGACTGITNHSIAFADKFCFMCRLKASISKPVCKSVLEARKLVALSENIFVGRPLRAQKRAIAARHASSCKDVTTSY